MASKPPAWAGINLACWSISTLQVCRVLVMVVSPWAPAERSDARLARSRVRRGSPAGWTTATSHRLFTFSSFVLSFVILIVFETE